MAIEPKEPGKQAPQPDVQPGRTPREIPQNKDIPEKETPPMQLARTNPARMPTPRITPRRRWCASIRNASRETSSVPSAAIVAFNSNLPSA